MYSSNNTSIYNYTNPGIPQMSPFSENDIIINSPSSLFNFPPNSPHMMYMEYEEDVYFQFPDIFNMPSSDEHHNHEINAETSRTQGFATKELSAAADDDEQKVMNINVRKRSSSSSGNKSTKKDRHSKINTARGPRDRRMRLSLDVARKFFDLQDLLGYDKASRTVEWLLNNSKSAIKELLSASAGISTTALSSTNCDDYCEVLSISSSTTTTTVTTNNHRNLGNVLKDTQGLGPSKLKGRKKMSKVNRRAKVERESRTKARERAKERTSQKRRLMRMSETMSITSHHHHHHQSNLSANNVRTMQAQYLSSNEPPLLLGYDGSWNHPSVQFSAGISNQLHNQELQEFQFCGKAWEDYNNVNQSG